MSDLQCPATFHVLGPDVPLDGPVARSFLGGPVYSGRLGQGEGSEELDVSRPLWDVLTELADLHRGMHVVVLPAEVVPPLACSDDVVTVRIDADGRSVERA